MLSHRKWLFSVPFLIIVLVVVNQLFFGSISNSNELKRVVIPPGAKQADITGILQKQGYLKYPWALQVARILEFKALTISPGGYKLSENMNVWQLADKLSRPDMKWATIPEGLRKEEIGEILAKTFNWPNSEVEKWNTEYTRTKQDYREGVYFPDTYLIPVVDKDDKIAEKFINNFNEKFAPYSLGFAKKDILWTSGLKVASLVQREAAGKEDMPLVAGIIWNRLDKDMKLEIDATVQYARGKTPQGWWAPLQASDLQIDSPFNTYLYKGLPPFPIANPGTDAIDAALNPAQTDCLYYLHDSNRQIHCAKTFEEHQANIKKYL